MIYKKLSAFFKGTAVSTALLTSSVYATEVTMETNMGNIVINLYDESTPKTVENFLDYVNKGRYDTSFIHRSVDDFIIQGGTFKWSIEGEQTKEQANRVTVRQIDESDDDDNDVFVVDNEPLWSNLKATIAMAKTSQENSATSSWFINLSDENAENLDLQSNGFTVFGEVIEGMEVVQAINDLPIYYVNSTFAEIPLQNFDAGSSLSGENLVYISRVTVTDTAVDSAKDLNPTQNTLIYDQNMELIAEVKSIISEYIGSAQGYLERAETAFKAAQAISQEKADIAAAAVINIEQKLLQLDEQLKAAEQFVVDADNAKTNEETVLAIVEIREQAIEVYYEAYDSVSAAYQAAVSAENAAETEQKEESGGGSLSWFLLALAGLVVTRRIKQA
ncbi:GlyGly-CTERM sorting domain-containing protein [Alteromonas aestuariivivens]|uniref:peptidylprolyl isomerase n=1 Tax=Alteromonas aestuariivivens TaxID=1938339 RepID=A0A3D8M3W1_9ALTE|nr:peptidylprolyl isomerase [Alteromonas aestuariivivens]RDV24321.1 GlyGly-CTERM sorting domain-containing protein [Alteromonas aestuariivivens]